jgi:hypothetical protein
VGGVPLHNAHAVIGAIQNATAPKQADRILIGSPLRDNEIDCCRLIARYLD